MRSLAFCCAAAVLLEFAWAQTGADAQASGVAATAGVAASGVAATAGVAASGVAGSGVAAPAEPETVAVPPPRPVTNPPQPPPTTTTTTRYVYVAPTTTTTTAPAAPTATTTTTTLSALQSLELKKAEEAAQKAEARRLTFEELQRQLGNPEEVQKILADIKNPMTDTAIDDINAADAHGWGLLINICSAYKRDHDTPTGPDFSSHTKVAEMLIQHGADVNQKDQRGRTPLFMCAKEGSLQMVRLLAKQTTNVDEGDGHHSPASRAARQGWPDIVQALQESGADLHHDTRNGSPHHHAKEKHHNGQDPHGHLLRTLNRSSEITTSTTTLYVYKAPEPPKYFGAKEAQAAFVAAAGGAAASRIREL